MLNISDQFNIKMRLVRFGLLILCVYDIGQVVADYCDRDSSLWTGIDKWDAYNDDFCEEHCLLNISLPRRYYNHSEMGEYNSKSKLLIQKKMSKNAFYKSNAYSSENKEYNTNTIQI